MEPASKAGGYTSLHIVGNTLLMTGLTLPNVIRNQTLPDSRPG